MGELVPTGCTLIKNVYKNTFLANSWIHDAHRRHVALKESGHSLWNIIECEDGYRIQNRTLEEDLFAAWDPQCPDDKRRGVFTYTDGFEGSTQAVWELEHVSGLRYRIRNKHHGEYLYSASKTFGNRIFTWRTPSDHGGDNSQFLWEIISLRYSY